MSKHRAIILTILMVTTVGLRSQTVAAQPAITATWIEEAPVIDGHLDDAVWATIPPLTDFVQVWPDEGERPTEHSEVRIGYNQNFLFFGFRFFDREPHLIRAKNLERGGRNDRDDHAYISLDTYLDKRNAYLFEVNALGTQDDATITDEGLTLDSFSWNAVFRSETVIDDEGWTMEVSIPFRQLRFPKADSLDFGLMISRMINRKNERVIWPPIGLEFGGQFGVLSAVSQYGVLKGLSNIRRGKNIEIKPYVISGIQQVKDVIPGEPLINTFERDLGVDFKYGITSNLTLDLTLNTDFAQVEADNVQLNLTRFNLFFPEKREFFLERSGLFEHGIPRSTQTFFSRRIGLTEQILAGSRVTGQIGRVSVGLMNIQTGEKFSDFMGRDSRNNAVARIRTTLFPRATAGVIFTSLTGSGQSNQAYGVDAQYRFWSASGIDLWYTAVQDEDPNRSDAAGRVNLVLENDRYGLDLDFVSVGKNYHPALGFVRRRDMRNYSAEWQFTPLVSYEFLPQVRQLMFQGELEYIESQAGEKQSDEIEIGAGVSFNRRDRMMIGYSNQFERLIRPFQIRSDASIPVGDYRFGQFEIQGQTDSSRRLFMEASLGTGQFFNGTRFDVMASAGFRQSRFLQLEGTVDYSRIDLPVTGGRFDATTLSLSILAAASRKLFATALVQYDNFSRDLQANLRVDWIHTPGSDLFFVFNTAYHFPEHGDRFDPHANVILNNRVAVAKLTYLVLL